ncbi:MAG TPA: glutaredoxin domain-containing protein [Methanolinea sp.]|nr:glutaredoxin domain-containing protein [Methanolinea sp.]HQK54975.1 glutaredoxin domain-containing protein [Methanolinea sp.]
MSRPNDLIVYTLEFCPNCNTLKHFLREKAVPFQERDLSTAESLTELRINGIFVSEAPVLQKDTRFLTSTEIFSQGAIRAEQVIPFIEGG